MANIDHQVKNLKFYFENLTQIGKTKKGTKVQDAFSLLELLQAESNPTNITKSLELLSFLIKTQEEQFKLQIQAIKEDKLK